MASAIASSTAGLRAHAALSARPSKAAANARRAQVVVRAATPQASSSSNSFSSRRDALFKGIAASAAALAISFSPISVPAAFADALPQEADSDQKLLCSPACEAALLDAELITTASGLQYRDIVVGDGSKPEPGFQIVVDYIAKNEKGLIFDNSLEKGKPNDIRVTGDPTSCTVVPGLDEGLLTMRSGGIRRLYIPGPLAFPKGLASAPGRPRISPFSPVVFDVKLIYIPGMD
eukprot:CAMPEP_0197578556 /NCGR_PEP_ID=MMETSP1326-20131121/2713_1 /TAXON_ID=1155430 /ORGANISM="Genus nov. species nov., Strain RCC2288" /LENGTH=232 /DNA_ID=CAMNT_0043141743 /DNA_START=176 /DNA_END=874 /DNA_ORIENTATION=+